MTPALGVGMVGYAFMGAAHHEELAAVGLLDGGEDADALVVVVVPHGVQPRGGLQQVRGDALPALGGEVGGLARPDREPVRRERVLEAAASQLLSANPKIDAIWNHDDDQGVGVLAAIKNAGRDEFFMVGGAGSANAMRDIKADNTVLKATVTYPPTMAGSAVALARLIAQGRGMSDLVEQEVPASITLASATVTKENVVQYLPLGFES